LRAKFGKATGRALPTCEHASTRRPPLAVLSVDPMTGTTSAVLALAIALTTGTVWFRRALAVNLPRNRTGFVVAMTLSLIHI